MRNPAVAGMFYPGSKEALRQQIASLAPRQPTPKIDAMGVRGADTLATHIQAA